MQATRTLPPGFDLLGSISLNGNRRLLILLNLLGIPWAILCAVFFIVMGSVLDGLRFSGSVTLTLPGLLLGLLALTLTFIVTLILHEVTHGLFFWLFTRARPRFGFKGVYAYAAAPGWYFPRPQFIIIGLAPLIALSVLGLLAWPLVPYPGSIALFFALFTNATGAIGDLYLTTRLFFVPRGVLIEDLGEGIRWFAPAVHR